MAEENKPMLTKQVSIMRAIEPKTNFDDSYVRARKRVEEIKEFYYSLISYCLVIPFLIFINYKTSWEFKWFWFPMLGWGMGLTFHAFETFGFGKSWEEKKIQEILQKEDKEESKWN